MPHGQDSILCGFSSFGRSHTDLVVDLLTPDDGPETDVDAMVLADR